MWFIVIIKKSDHWLIKQKIQLIAFVLHKQDKIEMLSSHLLGQCCFSQQLVLKPPTHALIRKIDLYSDDLAILYLLSSFVVKSTLANVSISWVVWQEISIPAVYVTKDRLCSDANVDLSIKDSHLLYPECSCFVLCYWKITDEIVESVVTCFDDFESIGRIKAKSKVVAVRIIGMVEATKVLLLDCQRLDRLL